MLGILLNWTILGNRRFWIGFFMTKELLYKNYTETFNPSVIVIYYSSKKKGMEFGEM